jgi:hypothetical protein
VDNQVRPHSLTFEAEQQAMRRRCSICQRRLADIAYFLTESDDAPEPRQSWLLCAACNAAVQAELARSELRSAIRTRVAVGLTASQRGPTRRPKWWQERYWEELDEVGWNRFIIWSIVIIGFGHVLVFVIFMFAAFVFR